MRRLVALALLVTACSSPQPNTTTDPPASPTEETTTSVVPTTQPVISVDASFALGTVVFGEQGSIEIVNTGPQAGNIHGHWIAMHPFYLELPSAIVEVGERVTVTFDIDASPGALVDASSLLPVPVASDGEIGLYSNGTFGDPTAIVDYVEWGSTGHFRSTVAMAAGLWEETRVVTTAGGEGGLVPVPGGPPQLLDAELAPLPAEG